MANGTVSLHTWNDSRHSTNNSNSTAQDDDEGDPPMGTNYNARLDVKEDYNEHSRITRGPRGGLRSRPVRPLRLGGDGVGVGVGGAGW